MKKKSKLNEFIQHTIDCESYGNVTKDEAVRLLKVLYEEISKKMRKTSYIFTKKTYTKLLEEIEELLKEYKADMTSLYESSIKDISLYQSEWLQDFMKELDVNLVIPAAIVSTIKFSPIAKTTDYKGLIDNNVYKIRQNVDSSLRTAYLTKEELNDVADRFDKREKVIEQNVEKDSKAIATTAFSLTSYLMYKANKRKVVYCAILDSKTCIECGMLNGKKYEISKAPELPQHFGCRCNLIPIEALEEEDMPEDFETWFESLSEEEKIEAVGPSRYKLYQMGVPVTRFVDNQNKLIPVKEIVAAPDINKFPQNQAIKEYAELIPNKNGYFDVAMHGTSQAVQYGDSFISARELSKIIEHNKDFDRQKGIRLLSCNTGNGSNCFAQQLANSLNCKVVAPNDTLYIYSNGMTRIGDDGKGKWITFTPGNK